MNSTKPVPLGENSALVVPATDAHDVQPGTVIRVIGSVSFAQFVTSKEKKLKMEKRRIFDEFRNVSGIKELLPITMPQVDRSTMRATSMGGGRAGWEQEAFSGYEVFEDTDDSDDEIAPDEVPPPVKDVEQYRAWQAGLKRHQVARFLKQYLHRSIPAAATSMGAVVLVTNTVVNTPAGVVVGDIARALNKGMFAVRSRAPEEIVLQSVQQRNEGHIAEPTLVCVHTWETAEEGAMPVQQAVGAVPELLPEFDGHVLLTTERDEAVEPAGHSAVVECCANLMRTLSEGNDAGSSKKQLPNRKKCSGLAFILMGGTHTAVEEVQQAAEAGWPILVLEGSGGYADTICKTIKRVEEVAGSQSLDDYRNCLGTVSPRTSSVINSGCVTIVRKGTSTEEFHKIIEQSATYDQTLYNAWAKYATWEENSQYCRALFIQLQILVLALGIMAIGLSIFQTFLQLQYPGETGINKTGAHSAHSSIIGQIYTWIGLVVVILPVGLSLVEAIENKLNAGGRWVALRAASETLLREIYLYRTQTLAYSNAAVRASQEKAMHSAIDHCSVQDEDEQESLPEDHPDGTVDRKIEENLSKADCKPFKSRQERLGHWVEILIGDLQDSDCGKNSLQDYAGPLPPHHILLNNDNGWADLTPEEYVAYRLQPLIARYERAAKHYETYVETFTIFNYLLGALGTLLAALSSMPPVEEYNLQAWVALTTGVSNALTRYMDYARMDFLQKKSNKMRMELQDVQSWWDSRKGSEAGTQHVRNGLVTQVESLVTGELIEWSGQMKKAMDKSKKDRTPNEDTADGSKQDAKTEEQDQINQLKELGLADINADGLKIALENPNGAEAARIFDSMTRLASHIEKNTGLEADLVLEHDLIKEQKMKLDALKHVVEQYLDDAGNLLDVNLGGIVMTDFVPADLAARLKVAKDRRKMFRDIDNYNPSLLSRADCVNILAAGGHGMLQTVQALPQRQMLETLKAAFVDQLHEELIAGLKNFKICIYDLIPRDEMLIELLFELRDIGHVEWREMLSSDILSLIKNEEIHGRMQELNEVALRGLLKRADKLFKSKTAQMFQAVIEKIGRLDAEELFSNQASKAEVFDALDSLQNLHLAFMKKDQLLAALPASVRSLPHLRNKPQAQIVEYITTIRNGFSASRIFNAFKVDFERSLTQNNTGKSVLTTVLRNKRLCDRFVFAVKSVSQVEINRCDKKMLLRKLAMNPAFSQDMIDEIKYLDETYLTKLMSGLKSFITNSYQGRVFDILCDDVTTFDLRNLLPDAEDREKFVNQVREFKGVTIRNATKQELITTLAYPSLVVKFLRLSIDQIRELVERALILMGNAFHNGVFTQALADVFADHGESLNEELERWDEETTDRLCMSLLRHSLKNFGQLPKEVSIESEAVVKQQLFRFLPDHALHAKFCSWDTPKQIQVFVHMRELLDERVLASVFEAASRELHQAKASKFQLVFVEPKNRVFMLQCLEPLLRHPFSTISDMDPAELIELMAGNRETEFADHVSEKEFFLRRLGDIFAEESIGSSPRSKASPSGHESRAIVLSLTANGGAGTTCRSSGSSEKLKDIVLHLLNTIVITTPYRLFLKLCLQITSFDLREILDDPQTRRLVAVVLFKSQGGDPRNLTSTTRGREILDACDELLEYEMVVNDLRMLTDEQLRELTHNVLHFFAERPIGQFFAQYIRESQNTRDYQKVEYGVLIEAVLSIKGALMMNPVAVQSDFRYFEADQFFSVLTEDDKMRVLQRYIADDSAVRKIARFTQQQLQQVFAHVRACPCSRAEEGESYMHVQPMDMLQHQTFARTHLTQNVLELRKLMSKVSGFTWSRRDFDTTNPTDIFS
ncbi:Transient receptor potential cation channel trpm [Diplonema papillatum]|nr:Transient receptor potential cation channel trpm [Diplonema papillatum]